MSVRVMLFKSKYEYAKPLHHYFEILTIEENIKSLQRKSTWKLTREDLPETLPVKVLLCTTKLKTTQTKVKLLYHATEEPQVKDLFYTKVVNYGILRSVKTYKSSHAEVFLGKGVLKISRKFTGEHSCRSVISMLLCNFIEITSAWVFSCKSAAYFKNTFSYEHLLVSASEIKKV